MLTDPMQRTTSWPQGHWGWPVALTHKHGVRCGSMIFTGGQVDLDSAGNVRNPNDLARQCAGAMGYLSDVLEDLGADLADLVRLVVYFAGEGAEEDRILNLLAAHLPAAANPVVNMVCMPDLCYPDMLVEIEGVAMRGESGDRLARDTLRSGAMPPLPHPFSHVVRCGEMIFTGDMSAVTADGTVEHPGNITSQSSVMMDQLGAALDLAGADFTDVVKLNVFYTGKGNAEEWEPPARIRADRFPDPGPAATGILLGGFARPGQMTKIAATAMRGADGTRLEKLFSWPDGHWDWTMKLPYKHGNRCAGMIHLGGQVSLDAAANVIDPDDMVAQTSRAIENIRTVLADLGANLDDVVKVTTFYQGSASAEALHDNLLIRSNAFTEPGPATTGIPVPNLVYEKMVIEIEVIAMVGV